MKVEKTTLNGVLVVEPEPFDKKTMGGEYFKDFRGKYLETYNEERYKKDGITVDFIQDDISISKKNVLRGIHGDSVTWKLISCLYGEFYFVAVDCNEESKDFGKWESFVLSDENMKQVLVPPRFGNAHLVLSETSIFHYKQSTYYDPSTQFTYKWDDPKFNIDWPTKNPILSERDGG